MSCFKASIWSQAFFFIMREIVEDDCLHRMWFNRSSCVSLPKRSVVHLTSSVAILSLWPVFDQLPAGGRLSSVACGSCRHAYSYLKGSWGGSAEAGVPSGGGARAETMQAGYNRAKLLTHNPSDWCGESLEIVIEVLMWSGAAGGRGESPFDPTSTNSLSGQQSVETSKKMQIPTWCWLEMKEITAQRFLWTPALKIKTIH